MNNVLLSRRYNSTDGVGSLNIVSFALSPAEFERWRSKFREEAVKVGGPEKMPRLENPNRGVVGPHADLVHAFCYNHEWLAFVKYLLDKQIQVKHLVHVTLGSRKWSDMDRNDAMTRLDEAVEAMVEVLSERHAFNVELLDSSGSMTFVGV
jgi:hypothetical protein